MLDSGRISDVLNEIPLFAGCAPNVITELAEIAIEHDFAKGDVIYETGAQALDIYILLQGLVSFTTASGVGHLHVETLMKRHMIFGWAALVPEHPKRLGRATCMEASKVLTLNGDRIMGVLEEHPRSGFIVMKRLCSMIASTFIEKK